MNRIILVVVSEWKEERKNKNNEEIDTQRKKETSEGKKFKVEKSLTGNYL